MTKRVVLYTDGACKGNPGPGGWGAVLSYGDQERELHGGEKNTTNNRMELMAAIQGLKALKRHCEVDLYTDSQYVRKGITEWMKNWKKNGWKRREGKQWKPIKNEDHWKQLDELLARHQVRFTRVKGHAGHPENERCDELAVEAALKFQ